MPINDDQKKRLEQRLADIDARLASLDGSSAPQPQEDIGALTNFGRSFGQALIDQPRIAFNELTGDHAEAQEIRSEMAPTRPGLSRTLGSAAGNILPTAVALGATLIPEPSSSAAGIGYLAANAATKVPTAVFAYQGAQAAGHGLGAVRDYEDVTGEDVGGATKALVAGGYGLAAFGAEKLGFGGLKTAANSIGQRAALNIAKNWGRVPARQMAGILTKELVKTSATTGGIEATEEAIEQGMNNLIDNLYREQGLLEGVGEAFGQGFVGGAMLGPVGLGVGGASYRRNNVGQNAANVQQFAQNLGRDAGGYTVDDSLDPQAVIDPRIPLAGPETGYDTQPTVYQPQEPAQANTIDLEPVRPEATQLQPQMPLDNPVGPARQVGESVVVPGNVQAFTERLGEDTAGYGDANIATMRPEDIAVQAEQPPVVAPQPTQAQPTQTNAREQAASETETIRREARQARTGDAFEIVNQQTGEVVDTVGDIADAQAIVGDDPQLGIRPLNAPERTDRRPNRVAFQSPVNASTAGLATEQEVSDEAAAERVMQRLLNRQAKPIKPPVTTKQVDSITEKRRQLLGELKQPALPQGPLRSHRQSGHVSTAILADTVNAGLRSAKWTADHTTAAAHWLVRTGGDAVKSVVNATKALVKQFGASIRKHTPRIWQRMKTLARDEAGTFAPFGGLENAPQKEPTKPQRVAKKPTKSTTKPQITEKEATPKQVRKKLFTRDLDKSRTVQQAKGLGDAIGKGVLWWSRPLIRTIEAGRGQASRPLVQGGREAMNTARSYLGKWDNDLFAFLKKAGGNYFRTEGRKARSALHELRRVAYDSNGAGWTVFAAAADMGSGEAYNNLSPEAKKIVDEYRELALKIGSDAQKAGLLITLPGGKQIDFDPTKGGRFQRHFTEDMIRILRDGESSAEYKQLSEILGKVNGLTGKAALKQLNDMRAMVMEKHVAIERARVFKKMPTHIRIGNREVQLLRSDPYNAARSLAATTAQRLGFIKAFGQDDTEVQKLAKQYAEDNYGGQNDVQDYLYALNGMPLELPIYTPGSNASEAMRTANMIMGVYRTALLTRSFIPNAPEVLAKVPAMVGVRRWLQTWGDIITNTNDLKIETARLYARSRDTENWMIEPGKARESIVRIARDIGLVLPRAVNEFNEFFAAAAGVRFANDLKAGRVASADITRLELMGFTKPEIDSLITQKADTELYNRVARSMSEYTQGSTSMAAERSRAAHSRRWKTAVAFDSFSQFTMDRTLQVLKKLKDNPGDPNAAKVAATYLMGSGASGAGALLLSALATGGLYGLKLKLEESEDDPTGFVRESLFYVLMGGPAEALVQSMGESGSERSAKALLRTVQPVSMILDAKDAIKGEGSYRNMEATERFSTFLQRGVTVSKPVRVWAASMGLTDRDVELDAAISAYYRWKQKEGLMTGSAGSPPNEETRQFRLHMRKAGTEIRNSKNPTRHIHNALRFSGKNMKSAAASLRGKRLLKSLNQQQKNALRRRIGNDAYMRLTQYDQLLEAWAGAYTGR